MKLQILSVGQSPIDGYKLIYVDRNNIDISSIISNECESILAPDVLDSFSKDGIRQILQALLSILRLNGTLVVGGTDVRLFATAVLSGEISVQEASDIVTSRNSMTSSTMVVETLKELGLSIETVIMNGIHYEIKAVRKN